MASKNWIIGLGSAAALALLAAPAHAGASIHFSVGAPLYYQPQPYAYAPQPYVYAQPGYVVAPSYGYYYNQPRYYHRGGRDRDWDGVPNRYDRDRDGDGVPNRYDRRPNNPYRR